MRPTFIVAPTLQASRMAAERLFYYSDLDRVSQRMFYTLLLEERSMQKLRGIRDAVIVVTKECDPKHQLIEMLRLNAPVYHWPILIEQQSPL